MTLLLTCVSKDFVVQASDRRLTKLPRGSKEDAKNKATILGNFASFAFTGLAECGRLRTDELLLHSLAPPLKIRDLIANLTQEATAAFNKVNARNPDKRTSFVGAGFVAIRAAESPYLNPPEDDLYPFLAVISNAQDLTEQWRNRSDPYFSTHFALLAENRPLLFHAAGQPIRDDLRIRLLRDIGHCLERATHAEAVARLLARAIRNVASKNRFVGPNVMCSLMRRHHAKNPPNPIGGPFPVTLDYMDEINYFRRLPDSESNWIYSPGDPQSLEHYGPNYVCDGLAMKGLSVTVGPGRSVEVSVQHRQFS